MARGPHAQVRYLIGEDAGIWPETICEDAEQPITLPAATLELVRQAMAENEEGQALVRTHLDPAHVAKVDAMTIDELADRLLDR